MFLVSHGNNFQIVAFFNLIENPKPIESQFPGSDWIGSKLFLFSGLRFGGRLQMRDNPRHDEALLIDFEISDVFFCALRDRNLILHLRMVSGKPAPLKLALGDMGDSTHKRSARITRAEPRVSCAASEPRSGVGFLGLDGAVLRF